MRFIFNIILNEWETVARTRSLCLFCGHFRAWAASGGRLIRISEDSLDLIQSTNHTKNATIWTLVSVTNISPDCLVESELPYSPILSHLYNKQEPGLKNLSALPLSDKKPRSGYFFLFWQSFNIWISIFSGQARERSEMRKHEKHLRAGHWAGLSKAHCILYSTKLRQQSFFF